MRQFFTNNDKLTALQAQYEAQKIAFAPIVFQVARTLRDLGVLELLLKNKEGVLLEDIVKHLEITSYGVQVLLETALSANIVKVEDSLWHLTKIGYFLQSDAMTNINMNYNHHVNYLGLFTLDESIKKEKPIGLKVFSNEETIYPALSTLPLKAKQSWFEFDHFYSDSAFPKACEILASFAPKNILDIGGNTGKFATMYALENKEATVTIMDLPQQIKLAKQTIYEKDLDNIATIEGNVLNAHTEIPKGYDIIWMSQFLDCFKEEQIVSILKKAKKALASSSQICIMEPFWDRQQNETAAYCVINTSPYFTALANGYSKMFCYTDFEKLLKKANLEVIEIIDSVGLCQTIIRCQ